MITISLNPDQVKTVLRALDGAIEDYHNEIRRSISDDEQDDGAYRSMMEAFEKLAGVKAVIEAQVAQH